MGTGPRGPVPFIDCLRGSIVIELCYMAKLYGIGELALFSCVRI